jgi:hypothetical protein
MDKTQHWYDIGVSGIDGIKIRGAESLVVPSGKVLERVVTLEVDPANLPETSNWVVFHIQSKQNPDITEEEEARFLGPSVF